MQAITEKMSKPFSFATDEWRYRKLYEKYRTLTMIGRHSYIGNLRLVARAADVPGSIVECGTWRGGMIAGIADILGSDRCYYLFDSFQGLPSAKEVDGPAALAWQSNTTGPEYYENCSASEEEARKTMSISRAKDYRIIKGWFNDTLPKVSLSMPIAVLRLDADWYESTKCILDNLASHVVPGGLIIVDDYYYYDGCAKAVNEFVSARNWRIRQSRYAGICFIEV